MSCTMYLARYPLDRQSCYINISTCKSHKLRYSCSTVVSTTSKVDENTEILTPVHLKLLKYWNQNWTEWLRHRPHNLATFRGNRCKGACSPTSWKKPTCDFVYTVLPSLSLILVVAYSEKYGRIFTIYTVRTKTLRTSDAERWWRRAGVTRVSQSGVVYIAAKTNVNNTWILFLAGAVCQRLILTEMNEWMNEWMSWKEENT